MRPGSPGALCDSCTQACASSGQTNGHGRLILLDYHFPLCPLACRTIQIIGLLLQLATQVQGRQPSIFRIYADVCDVMCNVVHKCRCVCACMRVCVCVHACACVHACCVCVCVRTQVCMASWLPWCLHALQPSPPHLFCAGGGSAVEGGLRVLRACLGGLHAPRLLARARIVPRWSAAAHGPSPRVGSAGEEGIGRAVAAAGRSRWLEGWWFTWWQPALPVLKSFSCSKGVLDEEAPEAKH